jgi:cytochrome c oxidase cbb3-type subunit 3
MARQKAYDELLDHEYDGIREYDNPCPAWWHLLFLGTFMFSVVYFIFFEIGPRMGTNGWTVVDAHDEAEAENLMLRFSEIGELQVNEATLVEYMDKPDWLKVGASVYARRCQSCHLPDGSGNVGPNLTDDNYRHVNGIVDIAKVVQDGAANGNMPAWRNQLHVNEVVLVSAYVASLRGQDLPGKSIDGEKPIAPWPTAAELAAEEQADPPADDEQSAGEAETAAAAPSDDSAAGDASAAGEE